MTVATDRGNMSFLSTGSPTVNRKRSERGSLSNDGGVEVRTVPFGRERSVSQI